MRAWEIEGQLAQGSASESLLRKARQDLQSCQAYLAKHFSRPANRAQKKGKALALRQMKRLAASIGSRDAAAIAKHSENLSKTVVYLWALRQFRTEGGE